MFATGSHQWAAPGTGLHDIKISDESEQAVWQHIHAENSQVVTEAMNLGDVSFHHGWTLHRADPNGTSQCREAHTIQYAADTMRWSAKANGGATGFGGVRTPG
jgi:ectoine hydroxylase-related dioxygenase (phytanoyl-CoA dioxygenase family)